VASIKALIETGELLHPRITKKRWETVQNLQLSDILELGEHGLKVLLHELGRAYPHAIAFTVNTFYRPPRHHWLWQFRRGWRNPHHIPVGERGVGHHPQPFRCGNGPHPPGILSPPPPAPSSTNAPANHREV